MPGENLQEPRQAKRNGTDAVMLTQEEAAMSYIEALGSLPSLRSIADSLDEIADHLSVLRLYIERKAVSENLFSQEDLAEEDDEPEEADNEEPEISA